MHLRLFTANPTRNPTQPQTAQMPPLQAIKKKKMKVKISIIIVGIFLFQFISSCCRNVKYYDFTKMDVQLSSNIIKQDENLTIKLIAIDLEYLSLNLSDFGFASSFALSCDDGWGGNEISF